VSDRRRMLQGLDQDIREHLERETQDNIDRGMSPEEARYAAVRKFGNITLVKEATREVWIFVWLEQLLQDVRFGVRVLAKSPGFTAVCVLTLALGIGANTAIFSLIDAALLRKLPVRDPQNLLLLRWNSRSELRHLSWSSYGDCETARNAASFASCSFSEPFFRDLQSQPGIFADLAAFNAGKGYSLTGNGPATEIESAEFVSGGYFQTLGIRPENGRLINCSDDAVSSSPVLVLSYAYWKSAFAASASAIGKTIFLNHVPFLIIGVAPPAFDALSPGRTIQMWLPLSTQRQLDLPWDNRDQDANFFRLVILGRLEATVSRAQAQTALSAHFFNDLVHGAKPMSNPDDNPAVSLLPAQVGLTGDTAEIAAPIYVLMLAVGVVLLIACANVAGLLLARAATRRKEMAVRYALGAGSLRIVRQLLTETLLVALAGGAVGLVLVKSAIAVISAVVSADPAGPYAPVPVISTRVLLFTAIISLATGMLFGLVPALRGMNRNLTPALKDAAGSPSSGHPLLRWFSLGNSLVVAQVALTVVVLAGAGLLVRTLQNLKNLDPGFDTRNLLTFRIDPTTLGYKRPEVDAFYRDLQNRLAALPGVNSVSYSYVTLLSGGSSSEDIHLPGKPKDETAEIAELSVGPDFLRTMRIPLRQGRELNSADYAIVARNEEETVAERHRLAVSINSSAKDLAAQNNAAISQRPPSPVIVNEELLRKYFPDQNPIGIRFGAHVADTDDTFANSGWIIVGVCGDTKYESLRKEVMPTVYLPFTGQAASFSLRTAANPLGFVGQVRGVVNEMDGNLPLTKVQTESHQIESRLFAERLIARLSSFFGVLALLLSCVGLYGLLSYEVARKTREIGIRMALGARSRQVLRPVLGQGLALTLTGAAIGIAIALAVTRYLGSLLYGVRPGDPLTLAVVAMCLVAVALLACYIPARRALRVDPLIALRYE
jgi:predicted permease